METEKIYYEVIGDMRRTRKRRVGVEEKEKSKLQSKKDKSRTAKVRAENKIAKSMNSEEHGKRLGNHFLAHEELKRQSEKPQIKKVRAWRKDHRTPRLRGKLSTGM